MSHYDRMVMSEFERELLRLLGGIGSTLKELVAATTPDEGLAYELDEARADAERYKADHLGACQLVAELYVAGTGAPHGQGPKTGPVEDVQAARDETTSLLAEARNLFEFQALSPGLKVAKRQAIDEWRERVAKVPGLGVPTEG